MVVAYETPSFRRRFILEEDRLVEGRSFRKGLEKGQVYYGRVLEHVKDLGYIVDLGPLKGLCQEKLSSDYEGLFEIVKYQEDKYPLITSKPGLLGRSLIFRTGPRAFSKGLAPGYIKLLDELDLDGVYFRRSAQDIPLRKVREEYQELKEIFSASYSEPGLIYEPPFIEEGDNFYKRELESRILSLSRGFLEKDDLKIYFEMTRAGLVIDVNGLGSPGDINSRAWPLIEEALILMNVGGLVMVDLVGKGQGYKGPGSLGPEGVLVRTYPQRGVNLFTTSKELLEKDYALFDERLNKEF